ncbi:Ig-like domain-containing protein [Paenibacillus alginolyticus]|uniref:Ig-like domain-containing protein n=1 Tax=Paenibacillus alginolyticus TaxID=59839 RepID=A0ABT4G879_9BACL|nr:Ig-like domain-containing protein [Paenibacillus alginolyticus]MCY9692349.1 Ig-like domain-containing protein [Paenibacillus alginolyticus]MEC0145810.1 Ig-like domain-containing protein [Paenibacillus alginolyticus]
MKSRQSKWLSLVFIFILAAQSLVTGTAFAADEISKLVLNKNELAMQVGDTANLTATAIFVSGSTENATVKTDWNSGSTDVASVYAGVVTAKKEGKAVITATYMGKTVIVNVDVSKKVKSLTKDKQSLALRLNATDQVKITAFYDDGTSEDVTSKADYTVDTSSIVTVTNGLVKGQNPGSATITIKFMNQSLTLPVDVEVVRRIDAQKSSVSLLLNGTEKIKLMATYPDGTIDDVSDKAVWTTDKANVADAIKGTVTGYSVGTANLTATYGTKSTTIKVDVDSTVKLSLDKPNILLKKNATETLKLEATYADGTTADFTDRAEWASSDADIVQVTKGKLSAVSIGEATIYAKYGDKVVTANVDVEVPRRLVVSADLLSLQTGQELPLILTATYADGTSGPVTDSAVWSVDNDTIAFVSKGKVTAYKSGEATVTAEYGGKKTTTKIEVDIPTLIKPSKKIVNLQKGGSEKVTLTAYFKDNRDAPDVTSLAEWTTSSKDIAEVRGGEITGISTGTATITGKYGTRTTSIQVSVGVLKSLTVSQEKLVMKKGDSVTLTAEAIYTDDTKNSNAAADVIWTSSNIKTATVDGGKVKALASGEATLTAQLDSKTVTITVQVDMASDLSANVANLVFDMNETRSIVLTATDASGAARTVTNEAEWKSSSAAIASVSKGVVTPVSRGKATITATYGGKSVSIPVEIGVIQTLVADKTFIVTKSGEQVQVKLTATLADGTTKDVTETATWKVMAYKLGTVTNGLFTATGSGKTTITGSFGGKMVAIPVEIDSLKYLKTDVVKIELQEGKTAQIEALATYTDGSEEDVTKPALWTSSNIMIADVKDGIIRATGKGSARITVTYSNMRTTVQVTVTK